MAFKINIGESVYIGGLSNNGSIFYDKSILSQLFFKVINSFDVTKNFNSLTKIKGTFINQISQFEKTFVKITEFNKFYKIIESDDKLTLKLNKTRKVKLINRKKYLEFLANKLKSKLMKILVPFLVISHIGFFVFALEFSNNLLFNFVDGGISDETPILIAQLFDENGINTVGNGIGHDLIAVIDGETGDPIVLNDFYTSDLDSYQSGQIRYNFTSLEPGAHTLAVKVWDVNNNSSETTIEFVVQEQVNMALDHVLNYPNPFTTSTEFYFEHNQVCSQLEAQIQIFTVSGRLVKTINEVVLTEGFRSDGIAWNGLDDFGDQLAKGVYVYRLIVTTPDDLRAEKTEKLVILK